MCDYVWQGGSADGSIIYATSAGIHTVDLKSGQVRDLPIRTTETQTVMDPVFLPEGDGYLYQMDSDGKKQVYRSSLSAKDAERDPVLDSTWRIALSRHPRTREWHIFYLQAEERVLVSRPIDPRTGVPSGTPVRLVDVISTHALGRFAAFSVAESGMITWRTTTTALPIRRLNWFDHSGNVVGTLGDRDAYSSIALSPDGSRVAAVRGFPTPHIWLFNSNGAGSRVSSFSGWEEDPVWSPDGRSLYYSALANGVQRVMRRQLDGGIEETICEIDPETQVLNDWTTSSNHDA